MNEKESGNDGGGTTPSSQLHIEDMSSRFRRTNNGAFFAAVRKRIDELAVEDEGIAHGGRAAIGLNGEYGIIGMACRQAQAILRRDRQPSHWSHAFLFYDEISPDPRVNASKNSAPWIWESSLEASTRFNQYHKQNGVAPRRLSDYNYSRFDPFRFHCVPNVAVVVFSMTAEEREKILDKANSPSLDDMEYDLVGLIGAWYRYVLHEPNAPNPLAKGQGVFCSAYIQLAYDAVGIDIAPVAQAHNTAPEHIWQTARWYGDSANSDRKVYLFYCIRDRTGGVIPHGFMPESDLLSLMEHG